MKWMIFAVVSDNILWMAACWLHFMMGPRVHRPWPNITSPHSLICFLIHSLLISSCLSLQNIIHIMWLLSSTEGGKEVWEKRESSRECFDVRAGGRLRKAVMRSKSRITLRMNTNLCLLWLPIPCSLFQPNWIVGRGGRHTVAGLAMKNWSQTLLSAAYHCLLQRQMEVNQVHRNKPQLLDLNHSFTFLVPVATLRFQRPDTQHVGFCQHCVMPPRQFS